MESDALARLAFEAMSDKHAEDLVILDMRPVSLVTDYFVIGTAETSRQLKAVVESVAEAVRLQTGQKPLLIEGQEDSGWVLMDVGGVIVHVFDPPRRAYYALEELWEEAPLVARMP